MAGGAPMSSASPGTKSSYAGEWAYDARRNRGPEMYRAAIAAVVVLATAPTSELALQRYETQRRPIMNAVTLKNRKFGPAIVMEIAEQRAPGGFRNIEDVISRRELEEISRAYKIEAGFDPVFCFDRVEGDILHDVVTRGDTDEFADRCLIGRLGEMHGDVPAPAGTFERGDRSLAFEKALGQEIDHALGCAFIANGKTGAMGGRGEGHWGRKARQCLRLKSDTTASPTVCLVPRRRRRALLWPGPRPLLRAPRQGQRARIHPRGLVCPACPAPGR